MTATPAGSPVLLVVGGTTGLVGRAVAAEFGRDHALRSVHRHPSAAEAAAGTVTHAADVGAVLDWRPYLERVDTVLTLAWYRQARRRQFVRLADGLVRLVRDAEEAGIRRFVHVSVPDAPPELEHDLPYLAEKRRVDQALRSSRLDYAIVRPTMLFGPRDVLTTVMLGTMSRYHLFPMFGDGEYHLSPVSVRDLASVLRVAGERGGRSDVLVGGPRRWRYREFTDALFGALGLRPRYVHLSRGSSLRLAQLLEGLGSSLLYAYEVVWLLSDMLGLPPYDGLDRPLADVTPFIEAEAARLRPGLRRTAGGVPS